MTNILNQFELSRSSQFLPSSPDEYFALRLAHHLGEPEAAAHYAGLAAQYSELRLLCAYRHATSCPKPGEKPARVFHEYLAAHNNGGSNGSPHSRLLTVRVERRAVAIAAFSGTHLEGWRVRQLSSELLKAEASATGFLREILSDHDSPTVAIESASDDTMRSALHHALVTHCREAGISVWEVSKNSVVEALAHPPPKSRGEMRELIRRMWPLPSRFQTQLCALDAFALGLYVQTERLFAADS